MYAVQNQFSYWTLVKKIGFTIILQLLLAVICLLKGETAYANFMSFFTFLFIASTSLLVTCVIKEKDDKLAMMAIVLQDIGIALQAIVGMEDSHRTMIVMAIGLAAAILFVMIMQRLTLMSWFNVHGAKFFGTILILAMMVMLVFGQAANGVAAWIAVGDGTIQITEIIKFLCLIFFSCVLSNQKQSELHKFIACLMMMLMTVGALFWIGELGTAMLVILVYILAVYLFLDWKYTKMNIFGLGAGILLGALGLFVIIHFQGWLGSHQMTTLVESANRVIHRILLVFNPQALAGTDLDYQLNQARKAMVTGGLLGNNQSVYIPVAQSDFIFIVLLANMGVLAGIIVIALFAGMVSLGLQQVSSQHHPGQFRQILSVLFLIEIGLRAFIMIAGTIGMMPMTGLAMPLLASGGTAALLTYSAIGYILFASEYRKIRRRWFR